MKQMVQIMTELCQSLKNWFDLNSGHEPYGHYTGKVQIVDGSIMVDGETVELVPGQYIRILDGILNNGVYKIGTDALTDETFDGAVWIMVVPIAVQELASDISAWQNKYAEAATSPYSSESFKGYSYTKSTVIGGSDGAGGVSWQSVFKSRLNAWRKL